jgi:hypothetical protein
MQGVQHAAVAVQDESLVEAVVVVLGISQDFLAPSGDDFPDFLAQHLDRDGVDQCGGRRALQGDTLFAQRPAHDDCIAVVVPDYDRSAVVDIPHFPAALLVVLEDILWESTSLPNAAPRIPADDRCARACAAARPPGQTTVLGG